MRKLLCVLLAVSLLSATSCGSKSSKSKPENDTSIIEESESKTAEETTTEEDNENTPSSWFVQHGTDDFGDETDKLYIMSYFYGTFSNSATNSSDLEVSVITDDESENRIYFILNEYGSIPCDFGKYNDGGTIEVKFKDTNGDVHVYDTMFFDNYIIFRDSDIAKQISENKELKFVIKYTSKYGNESTYKFTIDNSGFDKVYKEVFGHEVKE